MTYIFLYVTSLFLAAGAVFYANLAFQETSRQAKAAEDANRPWMWVHTNTVGESLLYENVGRSPTRGLLIDNVYANGAENPTDVIVSLCGKTVDHLTHVINKNTAIPGALWPVAVSDTPSGLVLKLNLHEGTIVGCIAYGTFDDKAIHHTGFTAHVVKTARGYELDRLYGEEAN